MLYIWTDNNSMNLLACSLQPVRETREKQVQLWKDLILDYCRSQKMYIISLEEDFPLFSNPSIESKLYSSESCFDYHSSAIQQNRSSLLIVVLSGMLKFFRT
jgi:hypothetical protein